MNDVPDELDLQEVLLFLTQWREEYRKGDDWIAQGEWWDQRVRKLESSVRYSIEVRDLNISPENSDSTGVKAGDGE